MFIEDLISNLRKSKYSLVFFLLACLQFTVALGLLIPALIQVKQITIEEYDGKSFKVTGEYIMFILFELWRLCLVIDGIAGMNSRTIYATASFTILSFLFCIMMMAESVNWMRAMQSVVETSTTATNNKLRTTNFILQIALGSVSLVLIVPTLLVARTVTKDFGWDVYKKIGSSIEIQALYNDLQWLSLILKIDIFFQFIAYVLYLLYEHFAFHPFNLPNSCVIIAFACALLPFYVLCRFSVSLESQFLMVFFILTQIALFANTIYTIASTFSTATNWYAYLMYSLAVLVATIFTIVLSTRCLLNFHKGLKEFVVWHPFKRTETKRQSTAYDHVFHKKQYQTSEITRLTTKVDIPIDD